jgi:biopolymer transport protein TolR
MVRAFKLYLPKTEGAQASSAPPRFVKLSIDAKGVVYLDDKAIALDDLKRSLNAQASKALTVDPGELPEVQLRADERVPYGKVVEVMGLAQQVGMNRIGFMTEPAGLGRPRKP